MDGTNVKHSCRLILNKKPKELNKNKSINQTFSSLVFNAQKTSCSATAVETEDRTKIINAIKTALNYHFSTEGNETCIPH